METNMQILLQNDGDTELLNAEGLRPIDICTNKRINELLLKKKQISNKKAPTISKGMVFQVSSPLYRLKKKVLLINPFKKIIYVENTEK